MAGLMKVAALGVVLVAVSLGGKWAQAQVHHVVGGDRGWDASSDVPSWSSGKVFRVGDKIWFTYSAAQGTIAELGSKTDYEACNLSNPIMMFTDGLDVISLEAEGIRYFASSSSEHCKNGLKLHVEVLPQQNYPGAGIRQVTASEEHQALAQATVADAPASPSGSAHFSASPFLLLLGLLGLLIAY